jgi:hypothetical protein
VDEILTKQRAKFDEILRTINEQSGVPVDALRAILHQMGDFAGTVDPGQIIKNLSAKAKEFRALTIPSRGSCSQAQKPPRETASDRRQALLNLPTVVSSWLPRLGTVNWR